MLTQNRRTPIGLLVFAGLLFAFAGEVSAQKTCKPRVDKGNIAVELTIPNFNGGERVVLSMPAKARGCRLNIGANCGSKRAVRLVPSAFPIASSIGLPADC